MLLPVLGVVLPVLPELGAVGVDDVDGIGVLGELVLPALAPPVVMPSSFRHFSRSAPSMPRHLLLALPDALLLPVLGEFALGKPLDELPLEGLPYEEPEEPELCAKAAPDSAKSATAVAALMSFKVIRCSFLRYLLVLPEEPLEPEPMPDPLLPELEPPMPLPGCLAAPLLLPLPDAPLPDAPLPEVLPLELVPPLEAAPEPDLLKCASHSARETCPSLFLSTDEKLGVEELEAPALAAPPEALGEEDELDEPPVALGEDELDVPPEVLLGEEDELEAPPEALPEALLSVALGLELLEPDAPVLEPEEPELCAIARLESAKSAAAVAVLITFNDM